MQPTQTFFMMLKTTTTWLQLKPADRFAFLGSTIKPILDKHPTVKLRFYDAEAFSGRLSDVAVWETSDVNGYQALVEDLRETAFWGTYFDVVDIIPTIENAYASHYDVKPFGTP
jgi:Darcynin, domain of unknown function